MRVVVWAPVRSVPGGHQVQRDGTVRALRALGVDVVEQAGPDLDLRGGRVDVVHGFGLSVEQVRQARSARVPVALSTIWCSARYTSRGPVTGRSTDLRRRLQATAVLSRAALLDHHPEKMAGWTSELRAAAVLFESADLLLPNSVAEAQTIRAELGVSTPCAVVPNAVAPELFTPGSPGGRDGVLMVGRFEPHKNQLGLIRALAGTGVRLTLVGPAHPDHPGYLDRCRRAAEGADVRFLPGATHEGLVAHYRAAAVHVLPSWYETTGLVTLEAVLCGCAVVTTSRGYTEEYFEQDAAYCDPAEPASIRRAVLAALAGGPSERLRQRVLDRFTWADAGRATAAAYRDLVT